MTTGESTIRFTPGEIDVLRAIVEDWIGEGFTTPPYTEEQYAIFEKLKAESWSYNIERPT